VSVGFEAATATRSPMVGQTLLDFVSIDETRWFSSERSRLEFSPTPMR